MITKDIVYIGADDKDLDLFEGQYPVPNGVAYNSYVILDEKIAVMDTVDKRKTEEFLANLEAALNGRQPDYLVVNHVEPDHAANIQCLQEKYPNMQLVGNAKTFQMLLLYFPDLDLSRSVTVKEGDTLCLGRHTLHFVMAPMVHWPEVMMTYDDCDKVLFSADGFGKFGALDTDEDWDCPPVLLQHRGQVRPPGAGGFEEGRRAGHPDHLPPPRPRAEGEPGPLSGEIRYLEQLRCGV